MKLVDWVRSKQKLIVFPINCLPATQLIDANINHILHSAKLKIQAAQTFADCFSPDVVFYPNDITVEAEALGARVQFFEDELPTVRGYPLYDLDNWGKLQVPDPCLNNRMLINIQTVRALSQQFKDKPVVAHVVGPFTLSGHLLGGKVAVRKVITDPALVRTALELATATIIRYAGALLDSGAKLLFVSEPLGSLLSPAQFREFSGRYLKKVFNSFSTMNILHVCGDTTSLIEEIAATGAQGLSLDNKVSLLAVEDRVSSDVVLTGNIDPLLVRDLSPEAVQKATEELISDMQARENFVLSTGCALPLKTPLKNVAVFMETGKAANRDSVETKKQLLKISSLAFAGKAEEVRRAVAEAVDQALCPRKILRSGLVRGIEKARLAYDSKQLYIPELLLVAEAVQKGLEKLRPLLGKEAGNPYRGRVIIGTVRGDIHDIGKNLVVLMLEGSGFEVFDLGTDVSTEQFLNRFREYQPDIVGMSAFTTGALKAMTEIIQTFEKAGVRNSAQFMIGGAVTSEQFAKRIGADGYAPDAAFAARKAEELLANVQRGE